MIFDAVNFCAIFGFGPLNHSKTFTDFKIKNLVIFYIHLHTFDLCNKFYCP